jgi:plasmid stabilization system protein ParE
VIRLSPEAEAQLDGLLQHYERLERIEAAENLLAALEQARDRIAWAPAAGLAAPRPYPQLAVRGLRWVKAGRYWVAYSTTTPPMIHGVFYEAADIPGRL